MEDRGLTAGEALSRQPWLPVCIGKDQLLAKAWFGDLAYHILLTDTRAVWAESMDSAAIQRRAQVGFKFMVTRKSSALCSVFS